MDEYEIVALAKRLNITLEDMKEMSFVSLANILLSSVDNEEGTRQATSEDIQKYFGQEEMNMETSTINIIVICVTILLLYGITIFRKNK